MDRAMSIRAGVFLILGGGLGLGCGSSPGAATPTDLVDWGEGRPDRVRVWRDGAGMHVQAFDGAVPPNLLVEVVGGPSTISDADGRFAFELPDETVSELVLRPEGQPPTPFRVREPAAARLQARGAVLGGAGSVPNDLVAGARDAVVVRTGDNAVGRFDYAAGLSGGVRLPDGPPRPGAEPVRASPWFVAPLDAAAARVVVSDTAQDVVHVVDLGSGVVTGRLEPPERVPLESDFELLRPFDVDGDGQVETRLSAVRPSFPQALHVEGDWVWAGFSGFEAPRLPGAGGESLPPVFQPAVLVGWPLGGGTPRSTVLPFLNPQWITPLGPGRVLVVCSGGLDPQDGRVDVLGESGLVEVDLDTGRVVQAVDLGAFAPGSAVVVADAWWVSSLVRGEVLRVDPETGGGRSITLTTAALDSVFRLVDFGGGLIGAPSFNTDQLFVVDARRATAGAFGGPIRLGGDGGLLDGLQVVARRPEVRFDAPGPEVFALLGIASQVVGVDLGAILGP